MVRIKICGLTDPDEAREVAGLGVDAIGLVFARSPRKVEMEQARAIVAVLPPLVQSVGVFVNETAEVIRRAVDHCGLDLVQLHGEEGPELCAALYPRVIKAVRVRSREDILRAVPYRDLVRGFLLDTHSEKAHGGTGVTFDWSLAVEAVDVLARPIILAGGIRPENVREAVGAVRPWGVDASSGVEATPGRKDLYRVRSLVEAVREIPVT